MNRTWSPTLFPTGWQGLSGGAPTWGGGLPATGHQRPYRVTQLAAGESAVTAPVDFQDEDPVKRRMRLEAVLLLAKTPMTTRKLAQLAHLADATEARTLIRQLNQIYDDFGRSLKIEQIAGGYRMMTRASLAPWLTRLGHLPAVVRLSSPMMETLAVVAYRQPVSRASVEAVRGVACGELLRQLMERDLIRIAGRSEELGRPYLYGTTKRFLQLFGLPSTDALPPMNWQTLQEDSHTQDLNPQDLSTPTKESVVSTAIASAVSETDPEAVSPVLSVVPELDGQSQDASAAIEDEENEIYDEEDEEDGDEEDEDFDDVEYEDDDEDWDEDEEDGDEDWDDEEDDDEDWDDDDDEEDLDEEEDDLGEEDEWEEVDDEDDDDIDDDDEEDWDEEEDDDEDWE